MEDFPALVEQKAQAELRVGQLAARVSELEEELAKHTASWRLTVNGNSWTLPSDGEFEWEGDGVKVRLVKE